MHGTNQTKPGEDFLGRHVKGPCPQIDTPDHDGDERDDGDDNRHDHHDNDHDDHDDHAHDDQD